MGRPVKWLRAAPEVEEKLRRRSRSTSIGMRDRERARLVLLRLAGVGVEAVAERLNTTPKRVSLWSGRFERSGLAGLEDRPGRGRKPSIPVAKVTRVIAEAARWPEPLEHPLDGPPCRGFGELGAAHLVQERAETASPKDLQAVQ